ncbi:MAG: polyribonucleotide nucleotidyltransferase [Candidatus Methylacidiphilales bacterium]|nr:polyribonucleotide nucleotidyltransferase [Candidatus Methylacidiphilales bacterium]
MSTPTQITATIGGKSITFESGKLAKLADGAVTVRCGDTIVIVTAVSATKVKDGQDFFPLTVEYKEKASAVGRFPGGYFKREGRPSEKEILTCRMTDRPLRPLFPKGYFYDTQIITLLLSGDGQNDPDILSINGASAALCVSDIPFNGPIGAVRIGRVDGKFVVNPTHKEMEFSDLDLVYAGNESEPIMIEGSGLEIPEADFKSAMAFAQEQVAILVQAQRELAAKVGKPKRNAPLMLVKDDLLEIAYQVAGDRIEAALYQPSKVDRYKSVEALRDEVKAAILAKYPTATGFEINQAFDYLQKKAVRGSMLDKKSRCDGRSFNQIRNLAGEVGLIPVVHGSSLFSRGETQAVCLTTLAPADEAQELDGYTGGEKTKRFILHYNFPPFSVGETGRFGGQNRREIGHGALAERSILPVIPPESEFPYAIRISSEVMESNGSTSMASVCGGVLSLMDAGVPLSAPVAGISVGLVSERDGDTGPFKRYELLDDILGSEDHFGDMDFKLCGTSKGITGFQLDLKLAGVPLSILNEAVDRATTSRAKILEFMNSVIAQPRTELAANAPRIETLRINPDKIGMLIGPGGKNVKGITAETGAEVNISDDGTVRIYCSNAEGMARAKELVEMVGAEVTVGKTYTGKVVSIKEFGAFVEVLPGQDGLVHISELSDTRVNKTEDVVKVGQVIQVKCIGVDDKGRVKLSRRAVLKDLATPGAVPTA